MLIEFEDSVRNLLLPRNLEGSKSQKSVHDMAVVRYIALSDKANTLMI